MSKRKASSEKLSDDQASAASTRLPDSEPGDEGCNYISDMETHMSKRSKSTPYRLKPISGQAKHIRRAMEYKGVMGKEELDRLTHQQVIDLGEAYKLDQQGCSVLTEERLSAFQSQPDKKVDPVAEMLGFNAVTYIAEAQKNNFAR